MGFARAAAKRVIFMDQGEIMEEGLPATIFSDPESERMKLFMSKILKG
jgi:ABC-type histidine transport system ATPase subunit